MRSSVFGITAAALAFWPVAAALAGGPVSFISQPHKMVCNADICKCIDAASAGFAGPAIQMCSAIIADPRSPPLEIGGAYLARAQAYQELQIYDNAIADSTEGLKVNIKRNDAYGIAGAYGRRASSYFAKKDDDKAIADLTAAIAEDPENPLRYSSRGSTYALMGKTDLALADYATALQHTGRQHIDLGEGLVKNITYTGADVYLERGWLDYLNGQFAQAATDIAYALKLEPQSAEAILWIHYARLHQGSDDRAEFSQNAATIPSTGWPGVLVQLFLGQATPEDVRRAQTPADHQIGVDKICDGSLAIAEWEYFIKHDNAAARGTYQVVVDSCPRSLDVAAAKMMLQKIP